MRGARLQTHHLFLGPSRCDEQLHRHLACRQSPLPRAVVQRQFARSRRFGRRSPLCQVVRPASKTQLLVCLGGGPIGVPRTTHCGAQRPRTCAANLCALGRPGQDRPRHAVAHGERGMGRSPLWFEPGPGALHGGGHLGLQHGRHGKQGLEYFQHQVRVGQPCHRYRHRLRQHRKRHWSRVFPQLDRQPHHVSRLVSAVTERRPHGFPRPGIQPRLGGF